MSKKNKGSEVVNYQSFKKTFPICNEIEIKNKDLNLQSISILLVEDNALVRLVTKIALDNYDCTLTETNNGIACVEILKKQKFDIILMDICMPEMNGIEATNIIRKNMGITIPIIAFTAIESKSEIEKFMEIGMDDCILKPFEEINLIETIAKYTVHKTDFIKA